jgi:glyoxalase family protein
MQARLGGMQLEGVATSPTAAGNLRLEDRAGRRLRAARRASTSPAWSSHCFRSIYLHEPGGILYEIADDAPGFTVDSPLEELGRRMILPPRLDPQRERIEARLTPLPDPRAAWATR